jgi:hypothetical protein
MAGLCGQLTSHWLSAIAHRLFAKHRAVPLQSTINYKPSTDFNRSPRIGYWLSVIGYSRSAAPFPLNQPSTYNFQPGSWHRALGYRLSPIGYSRSAVGRVTPLRAVDTILEFNTTSSIRSEIFVATSLPIAPSPVGATYAAPDGA